MRRRVFFIRVFTLALLFGSFLSLSVFPQSQSLKVGASRVDITPAANPDNPPLGKYEHEKLFVRAIVLDNGDSKAVLIAADAGGLRGNIYDDVTAYLNKELNCPAEYVIISATHTHSGSFFGPSPSGDNGGGNPVVDAIIKAIDQANAQLQPARVGYGTGKAYLNVNRDVIGKETRLWTQAANLNAPSDKTLAVMLFTDMEGKPIAGYMNYAMHPVNGYLSGIVSADFPGATCRYIENAFDDKMVMVYTQGAAGDQNPLYLRAGTNVMASRSGAEITGYEMTREEIEAPLRERRVESQDADPAVIESLERYMDALGVVLGEEAIRVMSNINDFKTDVRISGSADMLTCEGRTRTNTGREGQPGTYTDGEQVNIRLGLIGIGDIAITSVNAEVYNIISQEMKAASPMSNTMMVTICNGSANSGYIPDDEAFGRYTFQVLGSRLKPGCAEQGIVNGLVGLINQYLVKCDQ